jgi:HKD family nuclease
MVIAGVPQFVTVGIALAPGRAWLASVPALDAGGLPANRAPQAVFAANGRRRQTTSVQARIVLQPFEDDLSLLEILEQALADKRLSEFTAVVAWAKQSGLLRIRPLLSAFRDRGGFARIVLGVDEGGASIEGLRAAIADFDEALVLHDPKAGTFHPKLYMISGEKASIVVIGSSNLTHGGFIANYEAGVCLELDLAQDTDLQVHETVTRYAQRLRSDATSRPLTEDLIQQLLADPRFVIGTEKKPAAPALNPGSSDGLPALFGLSKYKKNKVPAPGPAGAPPQPAGPLHVGMPPGDDSAAGMDPATTGRVKKWGEAAYRHKLLIDQHGSMTQAESLAIRRQIFGTGPGVQRTVTMFGREGSNFILWMAHQEDGHTRGDDLVWLTEEGTRIAELWQASQAAATSA